MWPLLKFVMLLLRCVPAFFRNRNDQAIVELALRQQLATFALKGCKPRIAPVDRAFWVLLSRIWSGWKEVLVIVQPRTTARENVELPLFYSGVAKGERKRRATQALQQVGLVKRTEDFPNQLSGGEQQRVAIARALVTDPLLILADEPTGALDSKTGREILGLLTQLKDTRRTLILVTHDASIAAVAERKIIVLDGQVVPDEGKIAQRRESML